jgi:hypothetical protein
MNAHRKIWTCLALVVLGSLCGTCTSPAQGIKADPGLPPLPGGEDDVIETVISRFPNANRGAIMRFIGEEFPEEFEHVKSLSVRRVNEATDLMSYLVEQSLDFLEARQRDPALYRRLIARRRLERRVRAIAAGLREDGGPDQAAKQRELRQLLEKIFELKQELMKTDVAEIEQDLDELKALIAKRESHRQALIERRLSEIMGDTAYLKW